MFRSTMSSLVLRTCLPLLRRRHASVLSYLSVSSVGAKRPSIFSSRSHLFLPTSTCLAATKRMVSDLPKEYEFDHNYEQYPMCPLSEQLTPELREVLVGTVKAKNFRLDVIATHLNFWHAKHFPLPEKLSQDQWKTLMGFIAREPQLYYLDAINRGQDTEERIEELVQMDHDFFSSIQVDQKVIDKLIRKDPARKRRWDSAVSLFDTLIQQGESLWSRLTEDDVVHLLEASNHNRMMQTLGFIKTKRQKKFAQYIERRAKENLAPVKIQQYREQIENEEHLVYALGHNTMYIRFQDATLDHYNERRAAMAFQEWGRPLVIDLSFMNDMSFKQLKSLAYRELNYAVKFNREAPQPFALYFTNYREDCERCAIVKKAMPRLTDPDFPVMVTEKSYMDLFPKKDLVYLSPDSRTDLSFRPDDIYIIGGVVDNVDGKPYSLTSAKKQNIRHARLPIKKHLGVFPSLNVETVVAVMNDYVHTRDWFYSMRWVPARYLKNVLKSGAFTPEMEWFYKTHRNLLPKSFTSELAMIDPKEYRRRHKEEMASASKDTTPRNPMAYAPRDKRLKLDDQKRRFIDIIELR